MRAPQFGQDGRKRRARHGMTKPRGTPSPIVIPVEAGAANVDIIRPVKPSSFIRLNTGFWRGTGTGLRATQSPIETLTVEPYSGAVRSRGPAIQGQQPHGNYARDPAVKVKMHLWHKSARRKGVLVPELQGPDITKR